MMIRGHNIAGANAAIEQGADVAYTGGPRGEPPLMAAAREGMGAIMERLISKNADVNYQIPEEVPATPGSSDRSSPASGRKMKKEGKSAREKGGSGWSEKKSVDRQKGRPPTAVRHNSTSASSPSCSSSESKLSEDKTLQRTIGTGPGTDALMAASSRGHREACELLINAKANMQAVNQLGENALMAAAQGGHTTVAQQLHEAKADVHAVSKDGWDVLMFAANQGRFDVVKILTELIRLSRSRRHTVTPQMIADIYGKEMAPAGYTRMWSIESPARPSSPVKIKITDAREKIFLGDEIIPTDREPLIVDASPGPVLSDRERIVKNFVSGQRLDTPLQPKAPPPPNQVYQTMMGLDP